LKAPHFRPRPRNPRNRLYTSDISVQYPDKTTWRQTISRSYPEELKKWEEDYITHRRDLLDYLESYNIDLEKYDRHFLYHYGQEFDGEEYLSDTPVEKLIEETGMETETEETIADADTDAMVAAEKLQYIIMLQEQRYNGCQSIAPFLSDFDQIKSEVSRLDPNIPDGTFLMLLTSALRDPDVAPKEGMDSLLFMGPYEWLADQDDADVDT
jgi:hypothetical protein